MAVLYWLLVFSEIAKFAASARPFTNLESTFKSEKIFDFAMPSLLYFPLVLRPFTPDNLN